MYDFEDYLNELTQCHTQKQLEQLFLRTIKDLGYCAFDVYSVHINTLNNPKQLGNFIITSYPIKYAKKYVEQGFVKSCIGLAKAGHSSTAFDYIQYLQTQTNNKAAVWQLQLLHLYNINHAWLVPFNEVKVIKGVTVYMQDQKNTEEKFNASKPIIQLLSSYFFDALLSFDPSEEQMKMLKNQPHYSLLSDREIECLSWSAQGKTTEIIGQILSISENTVRFHMKNIFRKLNVSSRPQAILKASHLDLLPPLPERVGVK